MKNQLSKEQIVRNLKDAGCDETQIEAFIKCAKQEDVKKQILFLKCQRCSLLEELHDAQKRIDCLDYLIYTLNKSMTK